MKVKSLDQIKDKTIVVDTNIAIHYATKEFSERSGNFLRQLKDNDNKLVISAITAYELMCGDPTDTRQKYFASFIQYIQKIDIGAVVTYNATILKNIYKKFGCKHEIPIPDLLIGGTTTGLKNAYLLTADRNDFCEPLWNTVFSKTVFRNDKKGNVESETTIYLLEYNTDLHNE